MVSSHGPEHDGEIERGKRALAHDDGMHKFDGNVLRIGGVRPAPKSQQPASRKKALRHFAASFCQPGRFAREKTLEQSITRQQPLLDWSPARRLLHALSCL